MLKSVVEVMDSTAVRSTGLEKEDKKEGARGELCFNLFELL